MPKRPASRKQGNGGDYQSDFQKGFTEVKAIRFALLVPNFLLKVFGLASECFATIVVLLALMEKAVVHLLRRAGILRGSDLDELAEDVIGMATRVNRLIFRPGIGRSNLRDDFLGMSTMTEQRYNSNEHGEHAHAETYGQQRAIMLRVLGMLVQLLHIILADAVVVHGLGVLYESTLAPFRKHYPNARDGISSNNRSFVPIDKFSV